MTYIGLVIFLKRLIHIDEIKF